MKPSYKTDDDCPLTLEQAMGLLKLSLNPYHAEADTCLKSGAPLSSCVMVSAALEALLTTVTCLLFKEAILSKKAPRHKKGPHKGQLIPLLKWRFFDLLDVAIDCGWLPESLTLAPHLDFRPTKEPVPVGKIRAARNLVHPARYLMDRGQTDYTREELLILYATCHAAYDCIQKKVRESIRQRAGE
jgi:hypothetical protein